MPHRARAALRIAVAGAALLSAGCGRVGVTCPSLRPLCDEDDLAMAGPDLGGALPDLDSAVDGKRPRDLVLLADLVTPPDRDVRLDLPSAHDLVMEDLANPDRRDAALALDLALPPDLESLPDAVLRNDLMTPADMVQCNNVTCVDGCCSNGVCVKPTPLLCGIKGLICVKCAVGQLCLAGICL